MNESKDKGQIVEVFNGSRWEAELVKGLLESNGIIAEVKDGLISSLAPYLSPTVSVMVNDDQYDDAMEVIKNRDKNDDIPETVS